MTEKEILAIADAADIIVAGYAFTKCDLGFRVINLHDPRTALVISNDGDVLETSMNDIETAIALNYFNRNKEFLFDNPDDEDTEDDLYAAEF